MSGQAGFVKEILRLKPEVSSILNKDGFAAIHLASSNGFVEIVRQLLMVNHEHGHLTSSDSRTPLHVAAVTGRTEVIRELLSTCPESIGDVTARGETAFHLAVKNNHLAALKTLMESLNHSNIRDVLNAKDEDGNTVLHLATARKQGLIMKLLLGDGNMAGAAADVNIANNSGFTALDLLDVVQQVVNEPDDNILRDLLLRSGALRASELIMSSSAATPEVSHENSITEPPQLQNQQNVFVMKTSFLSTSRFWETSVKKLEQSSEGTKDALMVVVVLIAIFTYKYILQSPGGFDSGQGWLQAAIIASCMLLFIPFIVLNTLGFFTSIAVIILLINWFPLKSLLRLAMFRITATYVCCLLFFDSPIDMAVVVKADPVGFNMMARFGVEAGEFPIMKSL